MFCGFFVWFGKSSGIGWGFGGGSCLFLLEFGSFPPSFIAGLVVSPSVATGTASLVDRLS